MITLHIKVLTAGGWKKNKGRVQPKQVTLGSASVLSENMPTPCPQHDVDPFLRILQRVSPLVMIGSRIVVMETPCECCCSHPTQECAVLKAMDTQAGSLGLESSSPTF